ncbi:MAG: hypothetical protein RL551_1251, partial [Pseudomonadota bacterium]
MRDSFKFIFAVNAVTLCLSSSLFAQSADQIDDFTKAAKFDDVSEVQSLLKAGISPNTLDPKG